MKNKTMIAVLGIITLVTGLIVSPSDGHAEDNPLPPDNLDICEIRWTENYSCPGCMVMVIICEQDEMGCYWTRSAQYCAPDVDERNPALPSFPCKSREDDWMRICGEPYRRDRPLFLPRPGPGDVLLFRLQPPAVAPDRDPAQTARQVRPAGLSRLRPRPGAVAAPGPKASGDGGIRRSPAREELRPVTR